MDHFAMCKKEQEVASNNNDVKKELSDPKTIGLAADRKVKTTMKYVPTTLTTNSNASYDVSSIDINEEYP